jgi:hypothetical protein
MKTSSETRQIIKFIAGVFFFVTISLYGCVTLEQGFIVENNDLYVHKYSSVEFPKKLASFQRIKIRNYDYSGYEVSASYHLHEPVQAVTTIYVYPDTLSGGVMNIELQFENIKSSIIVYHDNAEWLGDLDVEYGHGIDKLQGKKATFIIQDEASFPGQQVIAYVFLFKRDMWFIELQITYPRNLPNTIEKEVDRFLNSLRVRNTI